MWKVRFGEDHCCTNNCSPQDCSCVIVYLNNNNNKKPGRPVCFLFFFVFFKLILLANDSCLCQHNFTAFQNSLCFSTSRNKIGGLLHKAGFVISEITSGLTLSVMKLVHFLLEDISMVTYAAGLTCSRAGYETNQFSGKWHYHS